MNYSYIDRTFSHPILHPLVSLFRKSTYRATPFRNAIKQHFGEDMFFGTVGGEQPTYAPKVAVMASNEEGTRATLIANYNRRHSNISEDRKMSYEFLRASQPWAEMRVCEAAAATNATRNYYKAYLHNPTKRQFFDGALVSNNPAKIAFQECSLIWPDMKSRPLDILVSIGTSQDEEKIQAQVKSKVGPKHDPRG